MRAFSYTVAVKRLATAFPLIGMVGSGIMAQRVGLALLANRSPPEVHRWR